VPADRGHPAEIRRVLTLPASRDEGAFLLRIINECQVVAGRRIHMAVTVSINILIHYIFV